MTSLPIIPIPPLLPIPFFRGVIYVSFLCLPLARNTLSSDVCRRAALDTPAAPGYPLLAQRRRGPAIGYGAFRAPDARQASRPVHPNGGKDAGA